MVIALREPSRRGRSHGQDLEQGSLVGFAARVTGFYQRQGVKVHRGQFAINRIALLKKFLQLPQTLPAGSEAVRFLGGKDSGFDRRPLGLARPRHLTEYFIGHTRADSLGLAVHLRTQQGSCAFHIALLRQQKFHKVLLHVTWRRLCMRRTRGEIALPKDHLAVKVLEQLQQEGIVGQLNLDPV